MERVNPQIPSHLEKSFNAKIERHFTNTSDDVLAQFLLVKRNPSTRKAYTKDLNDFFRVTTGNVATKDEEQNRLRLTQRIRADRRLRRLVSQRLTRCPLF